jgi:tetratricopeptide (TPR) repeat protein
MKRRWVFCFAWVMFGANVYAQGNESRMLKDETRQVQPQFRYEAVVDAHKETLKAAGTQSDAAAEVNTAESKVNPIDAEKQLHKIEGSLGYASMAYQACRGPAGILAAIKDADSLLDAYPHSAEGYYLLGSGLKLQRSVCHQDTPAKHARTPANAFSMAYKFNPSEIKYFKSWALADPDSDNVVKPLEMMLEKDPTDAFAAYMIASRRDTPADRAIELLSGTEGCIAWQGNLLGELLEKRQELKKAKDAYEMDLPGRCQPIGITWYGTNLYREGEARFNLARVNLALGDLYESLRQLRFALWMNVDTVLTVVDPEKAEALEKELNKQLKKKPLAKPRNLNAPEEVIMAFQKMAVLGDAKGFKSHVSSRFQGGESWVDDYKDCWEGDSVCLIRALHGLMLHAPSQVHCSKVKDRLAQCSISGGTLVVELMKEKGTWKVIRSERADWKSQPED